MSTATSSAPTDATTPTTSTFLEPERIKRPFPSDNAQDQDYDDEEDNMDDDYDNQSVLSTNEDRTLDSTSQPPAKTRKKPGRKPNPASPAVRKEQNRAAQRAFRDRKERHLQQLENMIKDLKETHQNATVRFQRESQQLKGIIESLQSENYYLREVVFSFESALGKTGNAALLQDVKVELYRRHYENHAARKLSVSTPVTPSADSLPSPSIAPTPTLATPPPMPGPVPVDDNIPQAVQVQMLNQAMNAAMAAHNAAMAANSNANVNAALAAAAAAATPSKQSYTSLPMSMNTSTSTSNSWTNLGLSDPQDDNIFSMNSDVLYKASAPTLASQSTDARSSSGSVDPIASARANLAASANWLSKQTFDDLQATLFAHANTSSSPNNSNSKMSSVSPQTSNADSSLFGQMDQSSFSPNQNMFTFTAGSMDSGFPNQNSFLDSDDVDSNEFTLASHNLELDDSLKQQQHDILPIYRLQMELRVLASAAPATDPSIDPKIYAIPHDTRIDLIPCPKLRAKMILHQNEYNIEELCQLLLGGAICHGPPLDPHNWELPRAFFDRYGYLMGAELMKYKNKVWPKKTENMRHNTFKTF